MLSLSKHVPGHTPFDKLRTNGRAWRKADIADRAIVRLCDCAIVRQPTFMAQTARDADEATRLSLVYWSGLVLVPGMLFVFGLIYAVSPRHIPPTQGWANGTYVNACCKPLVLKDGVITAGDTSARYVVAEDKFGRMIDVSEGIGVSGNAVKFGGTFAFVHFNDNSMAQPALGEAKALHLIGLDSYADFTFVRRK